MTESNAPAVSIRDAKKNYGSFTALHRVTFDIADNEFFTLLGPSGCGKTTLLRMIAGFEDTTEGAIYLYGDEIENLPPDKRPKKWFDSSSLRPLQSANRARCPAGNNNVSHSPARWPRAPKFCCLMNRSLP